MNIIEETRRVLEGARYSVRRGHANDVLLFEDESLCGFVWEVPSTPEIIRQWQGRQDSFLREKDTQLRKAKEKSWNLYAVFLTGHDPSEAEKNELTRIEENFRGARKLARGGLHTPSQLIGALFPLIPIQNLVSLGEDDALSRLRSRLEAVPAPLLDGLLGKLEPAKLAELLLRTDETQSD